MLNEGKEIDSECCSSNGPTYALRALRFVKLIAVVRSFDNDDSSTYDLHFAGQLTGCQCRSSMTRVGYAKNSRGAGGTSRTREIVTGMKCLSACVRGRTTN